MFCFFNLPGVLACLVRDGGEVGDKTGWLQDGMDPTCITLPKDHLAESTLESEISPDCTIHWLKTPFETENESHQLPVTQVMNIIGKISYTAEGKPPGHLEDCP